MLVIISILIFILGLSFGSFLSVVINRLETNEKGIIFGRSHCVFCKKVLKNGDLIPLLSILILKGKCRFCHKKISYDYFFIELMTGLLAVLTFLKFPFLMDGVFDGWQLLTFVLYFIFGLFFIGIFFSDLKNMEIPDLLLFPFMGVSLIGSLFIAKTGLLSIVIATVIALVFFGGQIVLSKGKWLGEGDLYLGLAMAFIFGWQQFLIAICLTYGIGAILSLGLIAGKKVTPKTQVPFAPFMVMGSVLTIFLGERILNWYLQILNF